MWDVLTPEANKGCLYLQFEMLVDVCFGVKVGSPILWMKGGRVTVEGVRL